jgi:hypothetical protein
MALAWSTDVSKESLNDVDVGYIPMIDSLRYFSTTKSSECGVDIVICDQLVVTIDVVYGPASRMHEVDEHKDQQTKMYMIDILTSDLNARDEVLFKAKGWSIPSINSCNTMWQD